MTDQPARLAEVVSSIGVRRRTLALVFFLSSIVTPGCKRERKPYVPPRMEKKSVEAVAAGDKHSCLLSNDGTVRCWGTNERLQSGGGEKAYSVELASAKRPPLVGRAIAIASGEDHSCAILDGGEVQCWGTNGAGQLGPDVDPKKTPESAAAPPVKLSSPATALALGSSHTCALSKDERVRCWGSIAASTLVQGLEVDLGKGVRAKQIAARADITCVLAADDTVRCFGSTTRCTGGSIVSGPRCTDNHGVSGDRLHPIALGAGRRAVAVSVRKTGPAILLDDGSVKAASTGQEIEAILAGDGDRTPPFGDPWSTTDFAVSKPTASAAGNTMLCVLSPDGGVVCRNDFAELERFAFDRPAKQLVVGSHHGCVVLDDGTARCFGRNAAGELGGAVARGVGPPLTAK